MQLERQRPSVTARGELPCSDRTGRTSAEVRFGVGSGRSYRPRDGKCLADFRRKDYHRRNTAWQQRREELGVNRAVAFVMPVNRQMSSAVLMVVLQVMQVQQRSGA
jgi:hypothetical protein